MRKFWIALFLMLFTSTSVFATKLPEDLQNYFNQTFPKTMYRFDGVVILPDATVYLPLIPAKPVEVEQIEVKSTLPQGKALSNKPEVIIFNNSYVFLKVIPSPNGKKTVLVPNTVPVEISTGLLPQDMLVPSGLYIPENLKGIIGNLDVDMVSTPTLHVSVPQAKNNATNPVEQFRDKMYYVATGYAKNIQVLHAQNKAPVYSLEQKHVPNDMKGYDNLYLLVTYFGSDTMNVISLFDEQVIKQIHFETEPDEIIVVPEEKIAYVASAKGSSIYIVNLENMTLSKQIKINGFCEKFTLSDDGTKLFYVDKKNNEIWAVELDNKYLLKDIGKFPNVSKIAYVNGKIYIASRTKGRLAIVDYKTNALVAEAPITEKPVDMISDGTNLFVLGATENVIQVLDTNEDELTDTIYLNTKGFSSKMTKVDGTDLAIVSDSRANVYCVLDLKTKQIIKANTIEVPIRSIVVTDKVKK